MACCGTIPQLQDAPEQVPGSIPSGGGSGISGAAGPILAGASLVISGYMAIQGLGGGVTQTIKNWNSAVGGVQGNQFQVQTGGNPPGNNGVMTQDHTAGNSIATQWRSVRPKKYKRPTFHPDEGRVDEMIPERGLIAVGVIIISDGGSEAPEAVALLDGSEASVANQEL